jgi:hypothetical protein
MSTLAKTQKRTSWDIARVIQGDEFSWLKRFTTEKENWFKQVHVFGNSAKLMLMSTKSDKKGMYITGSLDYSLDNLPNFIKRHIDFSEVEKAKGSLNYRAFGLFFKDGKLIPRK